MSTSEDELRNLNQHTFDAEAKPQTPIDGRDWKTYLRDVLACNFSIKRFNGVVQNKCEMIEFIDGGVPAARVIDPTSVAVFQNLGDPRLGVVTCVVTLASNNKSYRNTKVFSQQPSGSWLCVYWQVAEVP
jgi:hypothetical protein